MTGPVNHGRFLIGVATGVLAGAALGITVAPSHRKIKRVANMAAKRVNEAVENLTDAIDL